jgi:hypothetical protein
MRVSAKFLEGFGGKLAEQWVAAVLTPAFVFWAGGAIAGIQRFGWTDIHDWFSRQPNSLQIAVLIAGFCLIAASAFVVQRFEFAVLRFLEGYWPAWLRWLRGWLVARQARQYERMGDRWQALMQLNPAQMTAEERDELVQLDWQQIHLPLGNQLMPTRLGNILRAAEQRPLDKYGLDAIVCWSRLWLLLPDAVKQELQVARANLNTTARLWLWSVLFVGWGIWELWAAPVGLLSAIVAYRWAIAAARTYGELIEATFDLYRHLLYESLRWHLPSDPNQEREAGRKLTEYLWRGF